MNFTKSKKILAMLLTFLIILSFGNQMTVHAGIGDGGNDGPITEGGSGNWRNAGGAPWPGQGTSQAWKAFSNTQIRAGKFKTESGLSRFINNDIKGNGFQRPDGTYEKLATSCQKSEFIWWTGSASTGFWYSIGKGTNTIPESKYQSMTGSMREKWNEYKRQFSKSWNSGNITLVCSGAFDGNEPKEIQFVGNERTYEWDGTPKSVSGYDAKRSKLSALEKGHIADGDAPRTETDVWVYEAPFKKQKVLDAGKNDVTKNYTLLKPIPGKLTITPPIPPPVPEKMDDWQCIDHQDDSATAFVFNTTTGSHGFTPTPAGSLNQTYGERETEAGKFAKSSTKPANMDPVDTWYNWKSTFEAGTDTITPELDLDSAGVSGTLSKYGGVYNILRNLQEDTYDVTHCQPQTRYRIPLYTCDQDGNCYLYGYKWSPWEDDGGRIVWTFDGPVTRYEKANYQIMSVNCNKDGFDRVKSQTGASDLSMANGDGGAALQTPEQEGPGPGPLGRRGHETGTDAFYNDGDSCKRRFNCIVDILPGANNDADNNKKNDELFSEEEYGKENDDINVPFDKNLIFFRDNIDRQVRADIWYPARTGVSDLDSYSGAAAERSYAKVYGGTPEANLTTIAPCNGAPKKGEVCPGMGDKFTEKEILKNEEKSWTGNKNRFLMKTQWASDKNKPYEMGVNWRYNATGHNKVPSIADGYEVKDMTDVKSYDFDVYCEFKNKDNSYRANIPQTPYADGKSNNPNWENKYRSLNSIKTLFTRSVSDTTK